AGRHLADLRAEGPGGFGDLWPAWSERSCPHYDEARRDATMTLGEQRSAGRVNSATHVEAKQERPWNRRLSEIDPRKNVQRFGVELRVQPPIARPRREIATGNGDSGGPSDESRE